MAFGFKFLYADQACTAYFGGQVGYNFQRLCKYFFQIYLTCFIVSGFYTHSRYYYDASYSAVLIFLFVS
jgi:hypothetical protein